MQDAEGRVERLALYNLPKRLSKAITIGQKIAITNPYMRMAKDGKPMIRVDDPASVQLLEKVAICHFCAKQAAKLFCCGKCRSALYCRYTSTCTSGRHAGQADKKCSSLCCTHHPLSKQCQVSDWKELNHKAVCFAE
jgi:hypothetical protein